MSIELKIKFKHLALEPAIIRREERKLKNQFHWLKQKHQIIDISFWEIYKNHPKLYKLHSKRYSLEHHRKTVVRNASRSTHLARAFIAGMPYDRVEKKRDDELLFKHVILPEVFRMVAKYSAKPLQKKYNRETKMTDYDAVEKENLMNAINKWCNLE
jgi:hypothetical protein